MIQLHEEIASFRKNKCDDEVRARANTALMTIAGIDLDEAAKMRMAAIAALRMKLGRLLERERLRGLGCHASYDLKKHIGLKAAFDMLGARARCNTAAP